MRITIAAVTPRKQRLKSGPSHELVREYVERSARYLPAETAFFDTEADLLQNLNRTSGRIPPHFVALDSRGKSFTSEEIAKYLGRIRDAGIQEMMFAIGPADGWSDTARERAGLVLSLGAITLPHELALVVLAEQVYRAQAILAGHPYHSGH